MNEQEKEITTAGNASVGADAAQSSSIDSNSIIDFTPDVKTFPDQRLIQLQMQPGYIETKTMRELYEQTCEPKPATIKGFLGLGLYLFVGDPKIGKSFCMLQMAYKVSRGEPFLGFEVPTPGTVLYVSLEDTDERLQDRLFKMFGTKVSDNLHFATKANKLDEHLLDQLSEFYSQHQDTRLIIIDTLQMIRKQTSTPCNYSADYADIDQLRTFAADRKISMILVHHMRKQDAADKTDMISGTNGLHGASDGVYLMYREEKSGNELVISTSTRDYASQTIHIKRDPVTLIFERSDDSEFDLEPKDAILEKVSTLVSADIPVWVGTATQMLAAAGIEMKPSALSYYLNVRSRKLFNDYHIRYEKGRTSQQRAIRLTWTPPAEKHDADDADDANDGEYESREVTV